jgi:hypothetical protein
MQKLTLFLGELQFKGLSVFRSRDTGEGLLNIEDVGC